MARMFWRSWDDTLDMGGLLTFWQQHIARHFPAQALRAVFDGAPSGAAANDAAAPAANDAAAPAAVTAQPVEASATPAAQAAGQASADPAAGQAPVGGGAAVGTHFTLPANAMRQVGTPGDDVMWGDSGVNLLIGRAGNDVLTGLGGRDLLVGGRGADTFAVGAAGDSSGADHDIIVGFDAAADHIDIAGEVTAIAGSVDSGELSRGSFDADLAAALDADALPSGEAVLFAPDSGDLAGRLFLVADGNGVAGYQAGEDYVWQLVAPHDLAAPLDASIFI